MLINNLNEFFTELVKFKFWNEFNKNSITLLFNDQKEIALDYISKSNLNELNNFLKKQELFVYDFLNFDDNEFIVIFSKNNNKLKLFKFFFQNYIKGDSKNIIKIGLMLWFPSCCIKTFYNFFKDISLKDYKYYYYDYLKNIYSNKMTNISLDIFKYDRNIFHTPCNYFCSKSIEIWNKTLIKRNSSYFYIYFKTNEYFKLNEDFKIIDSGIYYEFNDKFSKFLNEYSQKNMKELINNNFLKDNVNKDFFIVKFNR